MYARDTCAYARGFIVQGLPHPVQSYDKKKYLILKYPVKFIINLLLIVFGYIISTIGQMLS